MLSSSKSIRLYRIVEVLSTFSIGADLWTNPPPPFEIKLSSLVYWARRPHQCSSKQCITRERSCSIFATLQANVSIALDRWWTDLVWNQEHEACSLVWRYVRSVPRQPSIKLHTVAEMNVWSTQLQLVKSFSSAKIHLRVVCMSNIEIDQDPICDKTNHCTRYFVVLPLRSRALF